MNRPFRFRRGIHARFARHPKLWFAAHGGPNVPAYVTNAIAALVAEMRAERRG